MKIRGKTGYSVYIKDVERRTKRTELAGLFPLLPLKQYDIIYADPPWDYNNKIQFDRSSRAVDNVDLSRPIFISSASFQYPTIKLDELMKLDVPSIANENCLLFMWSSSPHLPQALELASSWGFEYRTVAFVWDKMVHNPGKYTLSNCELCLVFKRGKIPQPRGARNIQQLVRVPRRGHSEKPIQILHAIQQMFPTQQRIELFARKKYKGWDSWGIDVCESSEQDEQPLKQQRTLMQFLT